MENMGMSYRARMYLARAMADQRSGQILARMASEREQLFRQSVDTAYLAAQIAEVTGYKGDMLELVIAALVHDAGMLAVPDEIFLKKDRLTKEEKQAVREHVGYGITMLKGLGFSGTVLDVAGKHHERSNGSGYPDGVESPDIPRAAKIVMVCDVYGALTSDRPQRRAFNMYEACSMMSAMPLSMATLQAIKRCDDR